MVKFFNKLIKRLIYVIGLIFVLLLGGLGATAYVFHDNISTYYKNFQDKNNTLLNQTREVLFDVQRITSNPDLSTIPMRIDSAINTVDGSLDQFKTTISNTKSNVSSVEQSIQDIKESLKKNEFTLRLLSKEDYDNTMRRLDQFQTTAKDLNDKVIPNAEKIIDNVSTDLVDARKLHDIIDISQLLQNVDKTVEPISNIVNSLLEINNAVDSDKFSGSLKFVSFILMTVSSSLLSLGLLTFILRLIFYRSINGYVVKRSKAKEQLAEFFEKACQLYPELSNELVRGAEPIKQPETRTERYPE
ncbi:MG_279/MG_280 family protein [Mycoplasma tullyi]|uniref:MG_279/MG_280 family protein n=1 Tax=Mycoplasma tullyi TaxID=1612150 RepID=A0A7D7XUW6_9MOLU|nr:MG_279/MG_280 family protein [Mycoplasma tullyi]QMT98374.1 MG_279/MG_280 family protein [Mycoplasma tullyi]